MVSSEGGAATEPQPLYQQLVDSLDASIRRGEWGRGDRIPSERDLSDRFGVSRATVRQALDQLVQSGVLKKVQGRGTFVAVPINQPLARVTAFREAVAAQGLTPSLRILACTTALGDFVVCRLLALPADAAVARLTYLGLGDGQPLALYSSHLAAATFRGEVSAFCAAVAAGDAPPMPVEAYARRTGIRALTLQQSIEARGASAEEAAILAVEPGQAVFVVISLIYGPEERPLEYRQAVYRADRYRFNVERAQQL